MHNDIIRYYTGSTINGVFGRLSTARVSYVVAFSNLTLASTFWLRHIIWWAPHTILPS